jgi:tight adherence protein B
VLSPNALQVVIAILAASCIGGVLVAALFSQLHGALRAAGASRLSLRPIVQQFSAGDSVESQRKQSVEATLRELARGSRRSEEQPSLRGRMRQAGLEWTSKTYYLTCVVAGLVTGAAPLATGIDALSALGFGIAGGTLFHISSSVPREGGGQTLRGGVPNAVDVIVRGVTSGLPLGDCLRIIAARRKSPCAASFGQWSRNRLWECLWTRPSSAFQSAFHSGV